MKKTIIGLSILALLAVSVFAVTYNDNGNGTGNFCWNNVPDAKAARVLDGVADLYADRYFTFNETFTKDDLTNAQKLQLFNSVSVSFWNEVVQASEKQDSKEAWEAAFNAGFTSPMS